MTMHSLFLESGQCNTILTCMHAKNNYLLSTLCSAANHTACMIVLRASRRAADDVAHAGSQSIDEVASMSVTICTGCRCERSLHLCNMRMYAFTTHDIVLLIYAALPEPSSCEVLVPARVLPACNASDSSADFGKSVLTPFLY